MFFVDCIEQHTINTEVNIQQGNQQLTKAQSYQVAKLFIFRVE